MCHASMRGYLIAGILALLLVLGACTASGTTPGQTEGALLKSAPPATPSPPATPDERLRLYFAFIADGAYDKAYELLCAESRAQYTGAGFAAKCKNIYTGIEAKHLEITNVQVQAIPANDTTEAHALVTYVMHMETVAGRVKFANAATLFRGEGKEYGVLWSPSLIFPELTSDEDRVRVNVLSADRGSILDRNGMMLAGRGVASSVGLVPEKMNPEAAQDIALVAELLEMTSESVQKKLAASYVKPDTFVAIKSVPKSAMELKEKLLMIPGVKIVDVAVRVYPLGESASHLTGYVQGINAEELEAMSGQGYHMNSLIGKAGLEKIYEETLRAVDGREIVAVTGDGKTVKTLARKERRSGRDITLTIDAALQEKLYAQFARDKSCSVAMNPATGEVLALVSTPAYDANDFVLGMSSQKWASLNEDVNMPMYNRFKAAHCPGSIFKAITAAIGVNTGAIDPQENFGRSGLKWKKDDSWGGYYIKTTREYDGPANLENALAHSDNIYFAKASLRIGAQPFAEELIALGFEERIPFEYGLYSSVISPSESFTSEIQLADSGYGQGQLLANPIHMACVYAAFVNDGTIPRPRLILADTDAPMIPWVDRAFSAGTAEVVRNGLVQVIERGTGKEAKVRGLALAGKTGTAEIKKSKDDKTGTELGWFVLFNADEQTKNPLLVISMVEDVKDRGGSHYVIPGVRSVFVQ